jgi:hypothetical protein
LLYLLFFTYHFDKNLKLLIKKGEKQMKKLSLEHFETKGNEGTSYRRVSGLFLTPDKTVFSSLDKYMGGKVTIQYNNISKEITISTAKKSFTIPTLGSFSGKSRLFDFQGKKFSITSNKFFGTADATYSPQYTPVFVVSEIIIVAPEIIEKPEL